MAIEVMAAAATARKAAVVVEPRAKREATEARQAAHSPAVLPCVEVLPKRYGHRGTVTFAENFLRFLSMNYYVSL